MKKTTKEEFVTLANKVHNNQYDYSETKFENTKTVITINCPKHGYFDLIASVHLRGTKCPHCKEEAKGNYSPEKTIEFIKRSIKIHNGIYDYSKVKYVNSKLPVIILCPKHGEFETIPSTHLQGFKCPKCKYGGTGVAERTENFIKKALQKHKGRNYDYSLVKYNTNLDKIKIICPQHGEFIQEAKLHLHGKKCPTCAKNEGSEKQKTPFVIFQNKHEKINGTNNYKLDETSYNNSYSKIKIHCKTHGWVEQLPSTILKGKPCPICNVENQKNTLFQFISKGNEIHNNKYDYSLVEYKNSKTKVKIICPQHGIFRQSYGVHITLKAGCPICAHTNSKFEQWVANVIEEVSGIKPTKYKMQNKKHIDVLYNKIGFEANGLLYHNEGLVYGKLNNGGKPKQYHIEKTIQAELEGIKLYHIFEDEYIQKSDIVKNKILNACGLNIGKKCHARKTTINKISFIESKTFLEKYHIQGSDNSGIRYGAWLDGELVGVMTFKGGEDGVYDLNRYATNFNYHVRGLASRMLTYFEKEFLPKKIVTFADIRWTPDGENNLYITLGFNLVEKQGPVYHYYNKDIGTKRFNRVRFQKHKILKNNPQFNASMTEKEMMIELGYDRVWDCGNWKFEKIY